MDFEITEEQKLPKANARESMSKEVMHNFDNCEHRCKPLPKDIAIILMKKLAPLGYTGGCLCCVYFSPTAIADLQGFHNWNLRNKIRHRYLATIGRIV